MAVLDDVGDAGGRARIVLEHAEHAVLVAHNVGAADVNVGAEGHGEALHLGPVVGVAEDEILRHHPVLQDLPVVVDVVQEEVQRGNTLLHPRLEGAPLPGREHAGHHVEGQDAVDRGRLGVDREGDAEVEEVTLGRGGAAAQLLDRKGGEAPQHSGESAAIARARRRQLADIAARVIARQEHRRRLTARHPIRRAVRRPLHRAGPVPLHRRPLPCALRPALLP